MRALPPVLLLAVAACTVDTSSLKPKTDEQCRAVDASTKACGYKCVSVDDPATGCATPGSCSPCASTLAHTVPACDAGACTVFCESGWSDCNLSGTGAGSDGCEAQTGGNDPNRCGSCTRACPSGVCADGACDGLALSTITRPVNPQDLATIGGQIHYVDAGAVNVGTTAVGAIWNVDTNTKAFAGTGSAARWLAPMGPSAALFSGLSDGQLALGAVEFAFGFFQPFPVLAPASGTDALAGLLYVDPLAFFTAEQRDGVWYSDGAAAAVLDGAAPNARGFAFHAATRRVFYGTTANGGEVRSSVVTAGVPAAPVTVWSGAGLPSRLAVFEDSTGSFGGPLLFWISELDGSVRGALADGSGQIVELVAPQSDPRSPCGACQVDIEADARGVYWSNWWTGRLQMWRASEDRVLELGTSLAPFALEVRHPLVYWTDDVRNQIYVVPVP